MIDIWVRGDDGEPREMSRAEFDANQTRPLEPPYLGFGNYRICAACGNATPFREEGIILIFDGVDQHWHFHGHCHELYGDAFKLEFDQARIKFYAEVAEIKLKREHSERGNQ